MEGDIIRSDYRVFHSISTNHYLFLSYSVPDKTSDSRCSSSATLKGFNNTGIERENRSS